MTNEVYIVTNSVVTSLDVLKQINDMYSTEFTRLLTVMGLLVGFGAVVLPLWFQFREAKVRRAEMHSEFQQYIEQVREDLETGLQEKFEEHEVSVKKQMGSLDVKMAKEWARVAALGAHAQMKIAARDGEYPHAAECGLLAMRGSCVCGDHSNLLRLMEYMTTQICPNLKKEDLEERNLLEDFETAEKEMAAENSSGFLSDKLDAFKKAKKEILKRAT